MPTRVDKLFSFLVGDLPANEWEKKGIRLMYCDSFGTPDEPSSSTAPPSVDEPTAPTTPPTSVPETASQGEGFLPRSSTDVSGKSPGKEFPARRQLAY